VVEGGISLTIELVTAETQPYGSALWLMCDVVNELLRRLFRYRAFLKRTWIGL
jgi:hypothetical protein